MKKLLNILLLPVTASVNYLSIISCIQKSEVTVHDSTNSILIDDIVGKLRKTKMHLIMVQEFGKKDAVIKAMIKSFCDKKIFVNNITYYEKIKLYDLSNNTLIDYKNQNLISNLSKIRVKMVLKYLTEIKFVSFNIQVVATKQEKVMLEAEQKLNEKVIDIHVGKFQNKQLVIDGIEKSLVYKQNIIDNGIELVDDFKFINSSFTVITSDSEFKNGSIIGVKATFKFDNHYNFLIFLIRLVL